MSEITVRFDGPSADEFNAALIEQCARRLLQSYVYDEDGEECGVPSELARRINDQVVATIREEASRVAPEIVAKILETGVVQTDRYGYATGEPKTVASVIADQVRNDLYHGGNGRRGPGVLDTIIREEVSKQLRDELRAEVEAAKKPVLEAVRREATGVIEKAMADALAPLKF